MFGIGMPEFILILVVALVVFGPSKLPDLGKSLGKAIREFKNATNEFKSSIGIQDEDISGVKQAFQDMNTKFKDAILSEPELKSANPSSTASDTLVQKQETPPSPMPDKAPLQTPAQKEDGST